MALRGAAGVPAGRVAARRHARTVRLLEVETVNGGLMILSRWDLGTDPLKVLDALTDAGYAGGNRR